MGLLMLLTGGLWLVNALVRHYVFGLVAAAIYLLAGIAFIAAWIRLRRKRPDDSVATVSRLTSGR